MIKNIVFTVRRVLLPLLASSSLFGCAGTLEDPGQFDGRLACEGGCSESPNPAPGATGGEQAAGGAGGGAGAGGQAASPPTQPDGTTNLPAGDAARGEAVVAARGCRTCHGQTLAGSPGTDWSPNLTSDVTTGLGAWTDKQILDAVRSGTGRDGRELCGSMPVFPKNRIDDAAAADLIAFLRALPPLPETRAGVCK